ncbi:MAG: type II secretion system F family protein [Candidatus Aenigmarchaeota archaeon]|nr:type II secretion system F family protein [Candidatus Aenigmarchaeota archaeon]
MYQDLIHMFQRIGIKYFGKYLKPLEELIKKSNYPIIYEKYVGQLFFYCFLSLSIFSVYFLLLFLVFWSFDILFSALSSLILTTTITFLIATVFYIYPFYKYNLQLESLERNMPLGIAYMNIISKSGVPITRMFKYVAEAKEFGEFSKECERIYKNIYQVGEDVVSSMRSIALRTPSKNFKIFLLGFVTTIISGGNISLYLNEETKKELEIYEGKQQKYTSLMGFLADIFIIALLIAPLVVIIVLTTFSLIEPIFMSYEILFLIKLITYAVVPVMGIAFILFLNIVKI